MSNIDEFNRLTVHILNALYEMFPAHGILNVQDFHENVDAQAMANFDGTMTFLRDEGFLKYGVAAEGQLYVGVQLTRPGLTLLDKTPGSLGKGPTVGERIKSAMGIGSKEAFKEVVKFI